MKTTALICLLGLALNVPVNAQVRIVPRDAVVEGLTLDEWSAEWWKWIFAIPCSVSPWFDTNNVAAQVGQAGPVFFLTAGVSAGGNCAEVIPSVRVLTIPADKYVFVPIINSEHDNAGRLTPASPDELRAELFAFGETVGEVWASIDGVALTNLHTAANFLSSPVFSYSVPWPHDNVFECFGLTNAVNVDANGVVNPVVSGGYMLMLEPLPPGSHVIHTRGGFGTPVSICFEAFFLVQVPSTSLSDQIRNLKASIEQAEVVRGHSQFLLASLNAASSSFENNRFRPGINQMLAFQHKVRAMLGKELPSLADDLTQAAQAIIDHAASESE